MSFVQFDPFRLPVEECPVQKSAELAHVIVQRRSVRSFDSTPIDRAIIENALRIAGSAPSGANKQPWHFEIVQNEADKALIRSAAEEVEFAFYSNESTLKWREDLKSFGTNHVKTFLTEAPAIIAVFSRTYVQSQSGEVDLEKTYYPVESTGIAVGFLLTTFQQLGISTLTHTPKPAQFLNRFFGLDETYRPFMLIAAGHAKFGTTVPNIRRKELDEIARFDSRAMSALET